MLGHASLSETPLSTLAAPPEALVFSPTDIILRLATDDGDICLWLPDEVDDCSATPPTTPGGDNGTARVDNRPDVRFENSRRLLAAQEMDDIDVIQALAIWLQHI